MDNAVKVSSTHNAQTLLATTSFGVGAGAAKTPGSPQTGNLGQFSTTPLALLSRQRAKIGRTPVSGWEPLLNMDEVFMEDHTRG